MKNLEDMFQGKLHDLGEIVDQRYAGIYSPIYEQKEIKSFMSDYYENEAEAFSQADKIDMTGYYHPLLLESFNKIGFKIPAEANINILDVGCGFGSTTLPLIDLFPDATIVASELSLSMLFVLKKKLEALHLQDKCLLVQLNAEELNFCNNSFDVVVGAAILHHLFHPERVLAKLTHILKPGGVAVFFEPFENGMSIMGLIFNSIINDRRFNKIDKAARQYFKNTVDTWQKMKIQDKSDPFFQGIDDKWIFTKQYFYRLEEEFSFEKCLIFRIDKTDTPFRTLADAHFSGNGLTRLPLWIYEIIERYENWFSQDLKNDFLTEGSIIFKKANSLR